MVDEVPNVARETRFDTHRRPLFVRESVSCESTFPTKPCDFLASSPPAQHAKNPSASSWWMRFQLLPESRDSILTGARFSCGNRSLANRHFRPNLPVFRQIFTTSWFSTDRRVFPCAQRDSSPHVVKFFGAPAPTASNPLGHRSPSSPNRTRPRPREHMAIHSRG